MVAWHQYQFVLLNIGYSFNKHVTSWCWIPVACSAWDVVLAFEASLLALRRMIQEMVWEILRQATNWKCGKIDQKFRNVLAMIFCLDQKLERDWEYDEARAVSKASRSTCSGDFTCSLRMHIDVVVVVLAACAGAAFDVLGEGVDTQQGCDSNPMSFPQRR